MTAVSNFGLNIQAVLSEPLAKLPSQIVEYLR